jgi:hypothetical protein
MCCLIIVTSAQGGASPGDGMIWGDAFAPPLIIAAADQNFAATLKYTPRGGPT